MYKNASYKEKFADVKQWAPTIITNIKKEIKNEHLKKDLFFVKKYLNGKNLNKVTSEELTDAYLEALDSSENAEGIAEFLISSWLIRNPELYTLFETQLSQISPDFTDLEELTPEQAKSLIDQAVEQFGYFHTYLFSVFNSVVLPKESFEFLKKNAEKSHQDTIQQKLAQAEQLNLDGLVKNHEIEIVRLNDKHEKKFLGLQKKYQIDVDALKKQVASLQRKLQELSSK